jgi:hypothetical protein
MRVTVHAYERSPHSGAGNCHCGHAEHSRVHPHPYRQMHDSELCICVWPAGHPIHTDAATARPEPVRKGLDGVAAAVRAARGGHAPAQVRGYA